MVFVAVSSISMFRFFGSECISFQIYFITPPSFLESEAIFFISLLPLGGEGGGREILGKVEFSEVYDV